MNLFNILISSFFPLVLCGCFRSCGCSRRSLITLKPSVTRSTRRKFKAETRFQSLPVVTLTKPVTTQMTIATRSPLWLHMHWMTMHPILRRRSPCLLPENPFHPCPQRAARWIHIEARAQWKPQCQEVINRIRTIQSDRTKRHRQRVYMSVWTCWNKVMLGENKTQDESYRSEDGAVSMTADGLIGNLRVSGDKCGFEGQTLILKRLDVFCSSHSNCLLI